jgi:hypothetical protein
MSGPSGARGDTPEARSARNSEARGGRNTMTGRRHARSNADDMTARPSMFVKDSTRAHEMSRS